MPHRETRLTRNIATYLQSGDSVKLDVVGCQANNNLGYINHPANMGRVATAGLKDGITYLVGGVNPIMKPGEATVLGWGIIVKGSVPVIHEYFTIDDATRIALEKRRETGAEQKRKDLCGATNVNRLV